MKELKHTQTWYKCSVHNALCGFGTSRTFAVQNSIMFNRSNPNGKFVYNLLKFEKKEILSLSHFTYVFPTLQQTAVITLHMI